MNLKIRKRALLPNKEGYEFIAVLNDGTKVKTKIMKDENGLHYFNEFKQCIGWLPINYR